MPPSRTSVLQGRERVSDKPAVTAEAEAEKLLECGRKRPRWCHAYLCQGDYHDSDCVASHRPAVAAALAAKDARIAALEAALRPFANPDVFGDAYMKFAPRLMDEIASARTALSAQPGGVKTDA